MAKQNLGSQLMTQIAIVVEDMDAAIETYSRIFGMPKPEPSVTDAASANATYRGEPTQAQAKLAFFKMGQVVIELIEPLGPGSVWQEVLDEKGPGVHHIAFEIKDTDEVTDFLASEGMPVIQQGEYTGGMYTYVDSEPVLGVMLELLENFDEAA